MEMQAMMIEHEDHDRTPDRLRTKLSALVFVGLGLYSMVESIAFIVRRILG
jgi:hypothetical protein